MGCTLVEEKGSLTLTGGPLRGIDIDMETMPDVVLSLAIAAGIAEGETRITNHHHRLEPVPEAAKVLLL